MRRANYEVVEDRAGEPLVIRDLGPWDEYPTVTNAAEEVVAELFTGGKLPGGRRLFYFDSERTDEAPEGNLDELVHEGGVFKGFAPGPDRRKEDKS